MDALDDRMTLWPDDWLTGWLDDRMTRPDDQMTRWQEARQTIDSMVYFVINILHFLKHILPHKLFLQNEKMIKTAKELHTQEAALGKIALQTP